MRFAIFFFFFDFLNEFFFFLLPFLFSFHEFQDFYKMSSLFFLSSCFVVQSAFEHSWWISLINCGLFFVLLRHLYTFSVNLGTRLTQQVRNEASRNMYVITQATRRFYHHYRMLLLYSLFLTLLFF